MDITDFTPVSSDRFVTIEDAGPGSDNGLGHPGPGWPGDWWHVVAGRKDVLCTCNTQEKASMIADVLNEAHERKTTPPDTELERDRD